MQPTRFPKNAIVWQDAERQDAVLRERPLGFTSGIEHPGKAADGEGTLREVHGNSPGDMIAVRDFRLPRDQELLDLSVLCPRGTIAFDAMSWMRGKGGKIIAGDPCLLSEDMSAFPHTVATYTEFPIKSVRDRNTGAPIDALARYSLRSARISEQGVAQMKRKGRVEVACLRG